MIGKLIGVIEEIYKEYIILNVNNVGYIVYLGTHALTTLCIGENLTIYTIIYMYENNIKIYGFFSKLDVDYANILIKVKGISYKIATNLIDKLTPSVIKQAILSKQVLSLKIEGVGEKLAQRLITELYDVMITLPESNHLDKKINDETRKAKEDSILALLSLGYTLKKATQAVNAVSEKEVQLHTNDIIKLALKQL